MSKRIKIHLRIREHTKSVWRVEPPNLYYKLDNKKFSFDCFDSILHKQDNRNIYNNYIKDAIHQFKEGQSLTIFAYGQTGSGKTHTMLGGIEDGLVYLSLNDLFPGSLELSFIEIFNEKIYDLFTKKEVKLYSYENKCVLQNLHCEIASTKDKAREFIKSCVDNRKTGETNYNDVSSRSHAVLQIKRNDCVLSFIDLAGCEKSSNDINRMKEATFINRSLLSLGKLVNNMLNNKSFGFRDSKLTRILQDSISQKSSMIAFCMICPTKECINESMGTINFAGRLSNLDVHLTKTTLQDHEINDDNSESNKEDLLDKLKELEALLERRVLHQLHNDYVINQQKCRIGCLENMVVDLLKQIKDKKQEETFLLEKQLFYIKLNTDRLETKKEDENMMTDSLLLDYLCEL